MKMRMFVCGSFVAAAVMALATLAQAATLSVNFVGGRSGGGGAASVTGVAGAVQVGNWNNAALNAGSLPSAVDSNNNVAASVTWTAVTTYAALAAAPGGGGDADMMNGYLDNFGNSGNSVTVSGLGSQFTTLGYDIYVYFNADGSGTQGFSAVDNLSNLDTRFGNQAGGAGTNYPLAGPNGYIGSTQTSNTTTFAANYVLLTGFSGSSFTLTGVNGGVGDGRARINGFQVVGNVLPAPEPSTLVLLGVGAVGLSIRARRRRAAEEASDAAQVAAA